MAAACPVVVAMFRRHRDQGIALRRQLVAVTVAALVAGPTMAAAVPAADATRPKVLAGSSAKNTYLLEPGVDGRMGFAVRASDGVGVAGVVVALFAPGDDLTPAIEHPTELVSGTPQDGTWSAGFNVRLPMPAGRWTMRAFALDEAGNVSGPVARLPDPLATFSVLRGTRLEDAGAELAPGRSDVVIVRAKLLGATANRWAGLENRVVRAQFRREGSSRWVDKGPLTVRGSTYRKWFAGARDGSWRVRFDGTEKLAKAKGSPTHVDVG